MIIIVAQNEDFNRQRKIKILESFGYICRQCNHLEDLEKIIGEENVCEKIIVILNYSFYIKLNKKTKEKAKFIVIANKETQRRIKITAIDNSIDPESLFKHVQKKITNDL